MAGVVSAAAALLVAGALLVPNELDRITPGTFGRIPGEALLGVPAILLLPVRARTPVAALAGFGLGLLTILKIVDMGFHAVLSRPFNLVLDWAFVGNAVEFLTTSFGPVGEVGVLVGVGVAAVGLLALLTLSTVRLVHVVGRHHGTANGVCAALAVVWVTSTAIGAQIGPGLPITAISTAGFGYDRAHRVNVALHDQEVFAATARIDRFAGTPGDQLLTGLRGKDVVIALVESYGRDAIEDPELAAPVDALLDAGTRRLSAAGFEARSGFLTSPTSGGGSVLAHGTLLSGLEIDNRGRYRNLVSSDRLTLNRAFQRAGWRSVGVVPGVTQAWPEGSFFGYDQIYAAGDLGYRGPKFGWSTMPDQYTLSAFERLERSRVDRAPVMAEIPLLSSHLPWAPIPTLIDWAEVGDGSIFTPMEAAGLDREDVWSDPDRIRTEYRRAIEYSLSTLISYVETHGDDELVLVFLGDHQPVRLVTGADAGQDVPVTIVARDPAVLERISGWGWQEGLNPGPQAPVWPMAAFRDRFLSAFG